MEDHHVLMGSVIAGLCALGLWQSPWFAREVRWGQRITGWLGDKQGLLLLRILFSLGAAFGILLAAGIIRPVQW